MNKDEKIKVEFKVDDIFLDSKQANYYLDNKNANFYFFKIFLLKVIFHIFTVVAIGLVFLEYFDVNFLWIKLIWYLSVDIENPK